MKTSFNKGKLKHKSKMVSLSKCLFDILFLRTISPKLSPIIMVIDLRRLFCFFDFVNFHLTSINS